MLFKPAWMSKDEKKAVAAVKELKKKTQLARAANEALVPDARKWAVIKLSDQALLEEVGVSSENVDVRMAVAEKLLDRDKAQKIYEDIAKSEVSNIYRVSAAEILEDKALAQCVYAEVATSENISQLGREVASWLTDQNIILSHYPNPDLSLQFDLLRVMTDQQALLGIVKDDNSYFEYRSDAMGRLKRPALEELTDYECTQPLRCLTKQYGETKGKDWIKKVVKERLRVLDIPAICNDDHDWEYDHHDRRIYGEFVEPYTVYVCKRCGWQKEEQGITFKK